MSVVFFLVCILMLSGGRGGGGVCKMKGNEEREGDETKCVWMLDPRGRRMRMGWDGMGESQLRSECMYVCMNGWIDKVDKRG